jgi:hypothetical protein
MILIGCRAGAGSQEATDLHAQAVKESLEANSSRHHPQSAVLE